MDESLSNNKAVLGGLIAAVPIVLFYLKQKTKPKVDTGKYASPPFNGETFKTTVEAYSSREMMRIILKWQKDIGDIVRLKQPVENRMAVITGNLHLFQQVLGDRKSLKCGSKSVSMLHDFGPDVYTSEGEFWRHSKKGMLPALNAVRTKKVCAVAMRKIDILSKKLDEYAEKGTSFSPNIEMLELMYNITCDALFQYDLSYEEFMMVWTASEAVKVELRKGNIPLRWKFGFLVPAYREARKYGKDLLAFGHKLLDSYRSLESPSEDTIIHFINKNKNYKNDKERASDAIIMAFAAIDTTAYTLSHTLKMLAKYPHYQDQLRAELQSMAVEERPNSNLLHCIIKETMRLHPVGGTGSNRSIARDIVIKKDEKNDLKEDVMIPKGSMVICSFMMIHHNPRYFKDPEKFDPERWFDPTEEESQAFMNFGLGRRNCSGQNLAKPEMYNTISRLICKYEFSFENEGTDEFFVFHIPKDLRMLVKKLD
jgi:cytochrome P450